jgi:Metal-dependent amidase/aminoacylase/carboxypeptidase
MKDKIIAAIDRIREDLLDISDYILENPELAFQEYKAVDCLTNNWNPNGFTVEKGLGSLPTAFRATYEQGTGGPSIGLLCEYDALPGIGHACAHHMQGACMVGAAKSN